METTGKSFLGIDWGASDVGIALADPETRVAVPLTTLLNNTELISRIAEIVSREGVGTIVIGIPSYVNRKEVVYEGEKLGALLTRALPSVEIAYEDEMFTTKLAEQSLIRRGVKHIKEHDDEEAARIILQEWLDQTGKNKEFFPRQGV